MMPLFEVVCIGEPQIGEWFAVPGCLMKRLLMGTMDVEDLLQSASFPAPIPYMPFDFIGLEYSDSDEMLYYPARPPVVFTLEREMIDSMRERVTSGEQAEFVLLEAYANGLIERAEGGDD